MYSRYTIGNPENPHNVGDTEVIIYQKVAESVPLALAVYNIAMWLDVLVCTVCI